MPSGSNFAMKSQSYEKTSAEQKKLVCFLCRVPVTMLCANKETSHCGVSQSNIAKETLPKKVRCKKTPPPPPKNTASAAKNHRFPLQKL